MSAAPRHKKRALFPLVVVFFLVVVVLSLMTCFLISSHKPLSPPARDYQIVLIADNRKSFWDEVFRGAQEAADRYNAALQMESPSFEESDLELEYFEKAVMSEVDGIITHVENTEAILPYLSEAKEKGIPVFTIENDAPNGERESFVGSGSYAMGLEWGNQLVSYAEQTKKEEIHVALLSRENGTDASFDTMVQSGIHTAIQNHPQIQAELCPIDNSQPFSVENKIRNLLMERKDIDLILCTTADSTISAAETIIDMNRTSTTAIIGYYHSQEMDSYLKNGVIYSTISSDAYRMGYEAVEQMILSLQGIPVDSQIEIPISVYHAGQKDPASS